MSAIITTPKSARAIAIFARLSGFLNRTIAALTGWLAIGNSSGDVYRPERHYMRGPGPKSRRKSGATDSVAVTDSDLAFAKSRRIDAPSGTNGTTFANTTFANRSLFTADVLRIEMRNNHDAQ
jgi:hypothetical protein